MKIHNLPVDRIHRDASFRAGADISTADGEPIARIYGYAMSDGEAGLGPAACSLVDGAALPVVLVHGDSAADAEKRARLLRDRLAESDGLRWSIAPAA